MADFDPAMPMMGYTNKEWEVKEQWYASALAEITPSENPTPAYSQSMLVKLDAIVNTANIDAARMNSNFENYKLLLDIEEANARIAVQNQQMTIGKKDPGKLTVADIDALIVSYISANKYQNTGLSLYEIVMEYRKRSAFMKGVLSTLQVKQNEFITTSANIKSEIALNGMTPSVPNT